jgi:hypothetical protein
LGVWYTPRGAAPEPLYAERNSNVYRLLTGLILVLNVLVWPATGLAVERIVLFEKWSNGW